MKVKTLLKAAALIGVIGLVIILAQYKKVDVEYTGKAVYEKTDRLDVYFCPEDDCKGKIAEELNKAVESIHCAIYNVDEQEVLDAIKNSEADKKLVTDKDNKNNLQGIKTIKNYNTQGLMHKKLMSQPKCLNTSRYPEVFMKQINLKLPEKLLAAAQRYIKSYGYRNIQELATESLREKIFEKNPYDETFSEKEIELIDKLIGISISKKHLGTEEGLMKALK